MKDNIVLIGMPASGKSTIGVLLAKALGYDYIDCDLLIQKRTGKLLSQVIEAVGVANFRDIECDVCANVQASRAVISTGGSAVYGERAMQHLSSIGTVVYLEDSYEAIESRLSKSKRNARQRGVAMEKDQTLRDIYEERIPLYERWAEITVNEGGRGVEEILSELIELVGGIGIEPLR